MNRKLNIRRPQGVLRNYRNTRQDLSPRESPGICPGCGNLDIRHFEPGEGDKRVFADCPSRTVQAIVLRTASISCHACRAILGTLETGLGQLHDEEPVYLKAFEKKLVVEMYQPRDGSSSSSEDEPLSCRGWTFQEWILSRRIVHFATGELLWDCLTAEGCECQSFLKPRASPSGVRRRGLTDEFEHWGMRDKSWHWGMMVNNYTNRHLTFDSDKLHALSGVAKFSAMERDVADCYIAGLWKSELPLSLLWRRDVARSGSDIGYRRPDKYLAPSWSWASIVGPVLCENLKRGMALCEVLEVSYQLASSNPCGSLETGSVMIRGPVARISGCVDIQGEETLETRRQRSINTVFIKDVPERSQSAHGEDAMFLAVRSCWDASTHSLVWEGLASEAVGNSQDCFTRIGAVTLGVKDQTRFARWWRKTRSRERSHEILIAAIGAMVQTISIV